MSPEQIAQVFSSLGRIEQKIDSAASNLTTHVAHDETVQKALFERVEKLQSGLDRQRGFMAAIGAVSGGVVAAVGYIVDKVFLGHPH